MNLLLNLSTRAKLFASFGVMFAFLVVVIGSAYLGIASIQASHRTLYERNFADVADLQDVLARQDEIRAYQLNRSEERRVGKECRL